MMSLRRPARLRVRRVVDHHGRLVEKSTLMAALWPDTIVEEANLAFQISALRKALDDGWEGESLIQTVPTRGYRFVGAVTPWVAGQTDVAAQVADAGGAETALEENDRGRGRFARRAGGRRSCDQLGTATIECALGAASGARRHAADREPE